MTKYFPIGLGTLFSIPVQIPRKLILPALLTLIMAFPTSPIVAADLQPEWQADEEEDDDEWEVEAFANLFFMLGGVGSGTSNSIVARDAPNFGPPTSQLSTADTAGSSGNFIELGANIYRNSIGIGGSILFSSGGSGGSALMGYEPLSHGGTPGVLGTGATPTFTNSVQNPLLLFNPPIVTSPGGFSAADGGVQVTSAATTFRSYELKLAYRSLPDCDEQDQKCLCPDKSIPVCESRWNVFVGPRFFELGEGQNIEMEAFNLSFLGGINPTSYSYFNLNAEANNDIYGLQIGGEYKLLRNYKDRLDLMVGGKIGIGINDIEADVSGVGVQFATSPLVTYGGNVSDKISTLFGQLDASVSFDLTKNIEISAGYRGLWIENVATLGAQYGQLDVAVGGVGGGQVVVDEMLMHMGRLGLKLSF